MKLKMLVPLSGPDYALSIGDKHDFADAEAERLVEAGYAVAAEVKTETPAAAKRADK